MGTGSSSSGTGGDDNSVRDRINSGDFQKISPPSSPSIMAKQDEMSYSGILVEKPDTETELTESSIKTSMNAVPSSKGATFAADLTTPPVSNRFKSRTNHNKPKTESVQPRRIVKATPPPSVPHVLDEVPASDSPSVSNHPTLSSPIGANATIHLLEESIERNDSKSKRLEKVSNRQKNDREKLLQEKRRMRSNSSSGNNNTGSDERPKVEANPFSRFLSAFRVDANSKHKRKETNTGLSDHHVDASDTKRVKYAYYDARAGPMDASNNKDIEDVDDEENTFPPTSISWIAAASVATVAVMVVAIVRGSKRS